MRSAVYTRGKEEVEMATIITMITTFFTAVLGWIPDVSAMVLADPLMMLGVVMMVAVFVFGAFRAFAKGA